MEKIVYIIGAGFSAPLGLPVMSNFLMKSKDQYFNNPDEYSHFEEVFKKIQTMSVIKNYYSADLFNIEEILSILEMEDYLDFNNDSDSKKFIQYIIDVIEYHTPKVKLYNNNLPANWYDYIFGQDHINKIYGAFTSSLLNLQFSRDDNNINIEMNKNPDYKYSIITLNYDKVFENHLDFLKNNFNIDSDIKFNKEALDCQDNLNVSLCKLHGCVDALNIVPPTWNKNSNSDLASVWGKSKKILEKANHIRILGYSLPTSDSYIKYLFKSSILESKHLKSLDVINLDPYGNVKKRYDQFIKFNYYRFINGDIKDYLQYNHQMPLERRMKNKTDKVKFNLLEQAHKLFIEKNKNNI